MRRAAFALVGMMVVAALQPGAALGQTPKPMATDELPPGHPPVGQAPNGAPGIAGDDDRAPTPTPASPHGGAGAGQAAFEPPPDTAEDQAGLPLGTIVVSVKDARDRPIPHAPVVLGVLHSSVAKGESRERFAREADGDGNARFDGLGIGSGTTYRVSSSRGPATYAVTPFALGDKLGKHVTLHAYETSASIEGLRVATQGAVYLALREGSIQIEQFFSVLNFDSVAWSADAAFALPDGFKAFNKQDSMDDVRVDEVPGKGAALRGTVSPGQHDVTFRYQVPLDGREKQTFRLEMPPHAWRVRVLSESSKSMTLAVGGFPDAQRMPSRDGKRVLMTERQGGVPSLEITVTGLPTAGWGRYVAAALAGVTLLGGFAYAFWKRDEDVFDDDSRAEFVEARDALVEEIVALERAHKAGDIGPKTYARVRASLVDALARIAAMLDRERSGGSRAA